jgi:hypothetical protein
MRYSVRKRRIEDKVYEALSSLEEEFGLNLKNYPEVVYMSKGTIPELLGLCPSLTDCVRESKQCGISRFLYKQNLVLITRDLPEHINEESAHCLHLNSANISLSRRTKADWFSINILIEMIGYLGSKVLDPSRKNQYRGYPDYFLIARKKEIDFKEALERIEDYEGDGEFNWTEFFVHQQGYTLAEKMFYALELGDLSTGSVSRIIKKDFNKEGSALRKFIDLRRRFWPVESPQFTS